MKVKEPEPTEQRRTLLAVNINMTCFYFRSSEELLLVRACGGFIGADYRCMFECRCEDEVGVET